MTDWMDFEMEAKKSMSEKLGVKLYEGRVDINGKYKKFDLVNEEEKIVGDVKKYSNTSGGNRPSAKFSTLNEYVWLMSLLEKHRKEKWRKILIVGEDRDMLDTYVKDFDCWLDDVEIYYYSRKDGLEKTR